MEGAQRLVCSLCQRIHYLDPKVAAACIPVLEDGQVVLVRRAIAPVGAWTYPGGYIDRGEPPRQAAVRETLEESGLSVELGRLQGVYCSAGSIVLVLVYRAQVARFTPRPGVECLEVRSFARSQIPWAELAFESTRQALEDFFDQAYQPPFGP